MMRVATQHPKYRGLVVMPDGTTETKAAAIDKGFTVSAVTPASSRSSSPSAVPATSIAYSNAGATVDAPTLYRMSIMALPEAIGRRSAAEQLAADHDTTTLPPSAAAELLRGLPTESITAQRTDTTMTELSAVDASRFRRLADIRVAALNLSAARGNDKAAVEMKRLRYALSTYDQGGITLGDALTGSGLDARKTITQIVRAR